MISIISKLKLAKYKDIEPEIFGDSINNLLFLRGLFYNITKTIS